MKKSTLVSVVVLFLTILCQKTYAGVPQGINYQSVARNSSGQLLTNQTIALKLTVHDSAVGGASIYSERHVVQTNAFGTFSVVVGGGIVLQGTFSGINWGLGSKSLQAEMDFTGGTNYTNLGASKLISVPYALYAGGSTGDITNIQYDTTGILNIYNTGGTIISTPKGGWLTGGNSGLSSANNYIGTIDNTDLIIKRGGKESIRYTTGGALLATGDTSIGVTPASGAGKRMMWIPSKGAFRAGTVTGTQWDNSNIGYGSSAIGTDVLASGTGAMAIGNNAQAIGNYSEAIGNNVIAKAANSMVIGSYNDTTGSGTGSGTSDVLFQIGNGTSSSRANALTVNRSGQVTAAQFIVGQSMALQDSSMSAALLGTANVGAQNKSYIRVQSLGLPLANTITLANGSRTGQILIIESQTTLPLLGYGIRLNDSGNLILNGNAELLNQDTIMLSWNGSSWVELSRSINH